MSPHTDAGALLPCPFCSHPSPRIGCDGDGTIAIYCRSMGCSAQNSADTYAMAVERWNTRQAASQGSAGGELPCFSELEDANTACVELAAKHGYATGHGDTVADMIREFSAQIPIVAQALPKPPYPTSEADKKLASDWYTWGFQSGFDAARKSSAQASTGPLCPYCFGLGKIEPLGEGKPLCQRCGDPIAHGFYCDPCHEKVLALSSAHREGEA